MKPVPALRIALILGIPVPLVLPEYGTSPEVVLILKSTLFLLFIVALAHARIARTVSSKIFLIYYGIFVLLIGLRWLRD